MNTLDPTKIKPYRTLIIGVSILIPLVVGLLFRIRIPGNLTFLPPIYAGFNALTAISLLGALFTIRKKTLYYIVN